MGRLGIPDLELHGLTGTYDGPDREVALGLIGAEHGSHQEITTSEVVTLFIDHESDEQSVLQKITFVPRK